MARILSRRNGLRPPQRTAARVELLKETSIMERWKENRYRLDDVGFYIGRRNGYGWRRTVSIPSWSRVMT
jgi:hypothetical protein